MADDNAPRGLGLNGAKSDLATVSLRLLVFSKMEMLAELPFVTAASGRPSLLKSATANSLGPKPTPKLEPGRNVPSPLPGRT